MNTKYKKGLEVTMLFHGFGYTSKEKQRVVNVSKGGSVITLDTNEEPSKCFRFDTQTGRCLNDITDFGCSRSLQLP